MSEKKVYSFSRLSAWDTCKLAFRYKYVDNIDGHDNWFSAFGTLAHHIFESVDKGEMRPEDAWGYWTSKYPELVLQEHPHTFGWQVKWYDEASDFFFSFKGWRTPAKKVEEYIEIDNGDYILRGYIDRASLDTDGWVITDHKSSNPFSAEDLKKKRRQLYLYAEAIRRTEGVFPKRLVFNFFRKKQFLVINFSEAEFYEAWAWADSTVHEIEEAIVTEGYDFNPTISPFFCKNICDFRAICPHAK